LNELERKFAIPSVRKPPRADEARQAIVDEVEKDVNQRNGPIYIKSKLKDKGIMIPRYVSTCQPSPTRALINVAWNMINRDTIRETMHDLDPQGIGFAQWYPGAKKRNLVLGSLSAIGPFHEISADSREKLSAQALQMGEIGLPIYGYKDKWADNILKLTLLPDCRMAGALGHLYLNFVEEIRGE
jgi:hypothetical protein